MYCRQSGDSNGGGYVFGQDNLVSSMIQSFIVAIATTVISMIFCIPAHIPLRDSNIAEERSLCCHFGLQNAFPKLGIYTSIAVLFYKYGLMGTYPGVIIIHMINSMMLWYGFLPALSGMCTGSRKKPREMWEPDRCVLSLK